jgi:hypothetical protein
LHQIEPDLLTSSTRSCRTLTLIRDGMHICGTKIFPAKLKQEPIQCMKCRKWGHVAAACLEASDTCSTCGGEHQTCSCNTTDKIHCVSCKANMHASWDRNCPEFIWRCALHNKKHPENNLIFFPMEEDWTLVVTPDRIPLNERFLQKYAVASLPPPSNKTQAHPTRPITKAPKPSQHQAKTNHDEEQSTLDRFLKNPDSAAHLNPLGSRGEVDKEGNEYTQHFDHFKNATIRSNGELHEIKGWD